jgi:hypothetical protein
MDSQALKAREEAALARRWIAARSCARRLFNACTASSHMHRHRACAEPRSLCSIWRTRPERSMRCLHLRTFTGPPQSAPPPTATAVPLTRGRSARRGGG